ncbi:MAG: UPF0175 family protein [Ruminococcus sp.]|nr:UPF0175 family protein [Ruminococcus sp.]
MNMANVNITVPKEMEDWINKADDYRIFERNAMMLYPYIRDLTISYGKATEILGVSKLDLIEFYGKMGLSYLNQSDEDIEKELAVYQNFKV